MYVHDITLSYLLGTIFPAVNLESSSKILHPVIFQMGSEAEVAHCDKTTKKVQYYTNFTKLSVLFWLEPF